MNSMPLSEISNKKATTSMHKIAIKWKNNISAEYLLGYVNVNQNWRM
jgi:hypothetical protein